DEEPVGDERVVGTLRLIGGAGALSSCSERGIDPDPCSRFPHRCHDAASNLTVAAVEAGLLGALGRGVIGVAGAAPLALLCDRADVAARVACCADGGAEFHGSCIESRCLRSVFR